MKLIVSIVVLCFFPLLALYALPDGEEGGVVVTEVELYKMGRQLVVSMHVEIARHVESNESIILTPVVQDSLGNRMMLPAIYINGRRQQIVFEREIRKKTFETESLRRLNGSTQTVHYLRSVHYEKWMGNSNLMLLEKGCSCLKAGENHERQVASFDRLADVRPSLAFLLPHTEKIKIREETGRAFLDFPVNDTVIHADFRVNRMELEKIMKPISRIKNDTNVFITRVNIHGYASPDGPYGKNEQLAMARAQALKDHVRSKHVFHDMLFFMQHTPEDWTGWIKRLNDTTFRNKKEMMAIVKSDIHPDLKESKIRKKFPEEYGRMLSNWFPALRHADYRVTYVVRSFTVEEAKRVFRETPKNLSVEEMYLVAQTYPRESREYNEIFMRAVALNPEHPVANLNAACVALLQGDLVAGRSFLSKAPECPETVLARGVVCMLEGDYPGAERLFVQAKEAGLPEAVENLKVLMRVK